MSVNWMFYEIQDGTKDIYYVPEASQSMEPRHPDAEREKVIDHG